MNIGWVGLGRLGGPAALTFAKAGHHVRGYDIKPVAIDHPNFTVAASLAEACNGAEVVFIAVQTPHGHGYGGEVPAPNEPKGFDTSYLTAAVKQVADVTDAVIAVVSTVLPGTCRSELLPLARGPLVYHPFFIAMGSVEHDIVHPEFVLLGSDDEAAAGLVAKVYDPVHHVPRYHVRLESAEVAKVAYNAVVSLKVCVGNAIMEISEKIGANCDEVTGVLAAAHNRVISSKYLHGGMGDGGPCHPRDGIAMQHLARSLGLSADVFGFTVRTREAQTRWLAELIAKTAAQEGLPVVLMGRAYKAGVDLEDGSSALLLHYYLKQMDVLLGMHVDHAWAIPVTEPAVYVIAKRDEEYTALPFPVGSVVIDPWGIMRDRDGITVHRVGR